MRNLGTVKGASQLPLCTKLASKFRRKDKHIESNSPWTIRKTFLKAAAAAIPSDHSFWWIQMGLDVNGLAVCWSEFLCSFYGTDKRIFIVTTSNTDFDGSLLPTRSYSSFSQVSIGVHRLKVSETMWLSAMTFVHQSWSKATAFWCYSWKSQSTSNLKASITKWLSDASITRKYDWVRFLSNLFVSSKPQFHEHAKPWPYKLGSNGIDLQLIPCFAGSFRGLTI